MRRLTFFLILTADGMYADLDGGLDHYDPAEPEHRFANDLMRDVGDEVMGRRMYEVMGYWDEVDIDDPATPDVERDFATHWRATPKHVVTRGRPELGPNATILEGDVVEAVRRMKAGDGPDIALGAGAELFATLAEAGLIDAYRFLVIPKAIGAGKALFASLTRPLDLRLVGTRTFESGAVLLEYEPASPTS
jgi:dihydrofolate reductase